jgi:hypothetical protein
MQPILTYSQATLSGKARYELFPDKIVIRGGVAGSYDYEQTLDLKKISPEYIRLRVRPKVAWISLCLSILTGFACFVLVQDFSVPDAIPGTLGIFSASAIIVAAATMKKVEYASFCSEGSGSVLLNVARSGPGRNQFDSFVNALVLQIDFAKQIIRPSLPEGSQSGLHEPFSG